MCGLRILLVEDRQNWRETLRLVLEELHLDDEPVIAETYEDALERIAAKSFDLAIVDLKLDGFYRGFTFISQLRKDQYNSACEVIVLTGYPTTRRVREAFREYSVFDFIEKGSFDQTQFLGLVRAAFLNSRLRRAREREIGRHRLVISFNKNNIISSEVSGPKRRGRSVSDVPGSLDLAKFMQRADNLNYLMKASPDVWRSEMLSLGTDLYKALENEAVIKEGLPQARTLSPGTGDLWLQFSGPAAGLGIPFELLHDGSGYLMSSQIITRSITYTGPVQSRHAETFHGFIGDLIGRKESLRILIVGSNSDGNIPSAEEEARYLKRAMERDLGNMGIGCEVATLTGQDATVTRFEQEMSHGRYHILHYAGHGRYADELPEVSGLIMLDGRRPQTITTNHLYQIASDAEQLRMVYLSCCLGGRTAADKGRGHFSGNLEALVKAGIPIVLGFKWMLDDESGMRIAEEFYHILWRSLSPGEALLGARRTILNKLGADDETWASPILLMQNI